MLNLKAGKTVAETIAGVSIIDFAVDLKAQQIHFTVEYKSEAGAAFRRNVFTIEPDRYQAVIDAAQDHNSGGAGVYQSIKQALYAEYVAISGDEGTVT